MEIIFFFSKRRIKGKVRRGSDSSRNDRPTNTNTTNGIDLLETNEYHQ